MSVTLSRATFFQAIGITAAAIGCIVFGAVYAISLHWGFTRLAMLDFGKFYYSTVAFLQGGDMYGPNPATFHRLDQIEHLDLNPPHFHLLLLPLVHLRPLLALSVWWVAGVCALAVSLRVIIAELGPRLTPAQWCWLVVVSLAFPGTLALVVGGQISWLLLLPVTFAWRAARHGRWVPAGASLGPALSVKPFLLIFLPYLLMRRQYRACLTTVLLAAGCILAGVLTFGLQPYHRWLAVVSVMNWAGTPLNGSLLAMLTRALGSGLYGDPVRTAPALIKPLWLIGAGLIGVTTLKASTRSVDRAFALLLLGALLISPLGWVYYLWLPVGPLAALLMTHPAVATGWRRIVSAVAVTGLFMPVDTAFLFEPRAWVSVSVGSPYFWGTLALWLTVLLSDGAGPPQAAQASLRADSRAVPSCS